MARLKDRYNDEIRDALIAKFGYTSPMQAPRLVKVTLNMGVGEAKQDSKMLEAAKSQLADIAGQQPNVRRARKSVAAFKLREGMPVGLTVTLRDVRAYEFIDRLTSVAIPREVLRRARQLQPGHPRAGHLPGDRLRRGRPGARARRGHHHDREDRPRGVRPPGRARDAVRARGAPQGVRKPQPARGGIATGENFSNG
jgi:hypothetical protein